MKVKMNAPAVTQLYQQKHLHQTHLRKLDQIREDRRSQLTFDNSRLSKQKDIRQTKSRSFAYRYNEQHQQITQSNIKFLNKLEKTRPVSHHTHHASFSEEPELFRNNTEQFRSSTPFQKRRLLQTEKENTRIYVKMKSVSSSLSKDKLLKDYSKSQQIKTRIARYATQNNRVSLKSGQFVPSLDKGKLVSHYNPRDILQNRVTHDICSNPLRQENSRPKQPLYQPTDTEDNRLFATEPEKMQPIKNRRKIFI